MIIVTGGAGFIGSNIIKGLNARGCKDILVVDNLEDGRKFKNIVDCDILDYLDQDDFLELIDAGDSLGVTIDAIFHEGACSTTTEWNGRYMMQNNYDYSKAVLHYALDFGIPFSYASSAATYGGNLVFKEGREHERPLNMYGYSKFLFDQYVRELLPSAESQIVGFKYFNVFGPREFHKGSMASVAYHFYQQLREHGHIKLFEGSDGYENGEQRRDFIYVNDVVAVKLWFMDHPEQSGIFNLGTGQAHSFNDVAHAVLSWFGRGDIHYIPFPDHLKGRYQSFTQADISALRATGCKVQFTALKKAVHEYMDFLKDQAE